MKELIDEYGLVIDLELAKKILIEYFSTGVYEYDDNDELIHKIKSDLIQVEEIDYTFRDEEGYTHFGGPDGDSGFWIQELNGWMEENKGCCSIDGIMSDINNERKVFYEVNGDLKCFILHESD